MMSRGLSHSFIDPFIHHLMHQSTPPPPKKGMYVWAQNKMNTSCVGTDVVSADAEAGMHAVCLPVVVVAESEVVVGRVK